MLGRLAADRGMAFVCVQTLLTSWARRSEDLTFDKTDEKNAVLIARLTAQARCYVRQCVGCGLWKGSSIGLSPLSQAVLWPVNERSNSLGRHAQH